jgi:two-component system, OmpR family, alkaline phosphatase synthesis response regulator PhoP
MPKRTVLVIDDEADLIELVRYNLAQDGFHVLSAQDGETGLWLASQEIPDMIIVDLMLPGIDGLEVCRSLRADIRTAQIPVIMLTARTSESDRVVGLELGADDYLIKPFSPRELTARIKALLRRAMGFRQPPVTIRKGDLLIDLASHKAFCGETPIVLTATEYRLLRFLALNPGQVHSRGTIIDGALGRDVSVLDRTIDVHITALRKKLGQCGDWIETVRGFGYKFREETPGEQGR